MASKSGSKKSSKRVETLLHEDASRTNIPSAEHQSVVGDDIAAAVAVAYERRNRDLDPQLVWRGKDAQDLSDLVVNAPPLYIQERVHPKVIIDDLKKSNLKEINSSLKNKKEVFKLKINAKWVANKFFEKNKNILVYKKLYEKLIDSDVKI